MENLVDAPGALGARDIGRKRELCCVPEHACDAQLLVQDVVLRYKADPSSQLVVVRVEIEAVVEHDPARCRSAAAQGMQQRRLAAARRSDHADERAFADVQAHPVDQRSRTEADGDVARPEGDLARVDVLLECVVDEPESSPADCDDVELLEPHLVADSLTVDEGAVVASEVGELVAVNGVAVQLGVVPRDEHVVDDEVVVRRAADRDVPKDPVDRGRTSDDGRRRHRGRACGDGRKSLLERKNRPPASAGADPLVGTARPRWLHSVLLLPLR